MAADDVARALMAMDDERLRRQVASGDLSALVGEFTENERGLLQRAAAAEPEDEVQGYDSWAPPYVPVGPVVGNVNLFAAVHYAQDGLRDPQLGHTFNAWSQRKSGGGW
ncbi:MAG: hypothetical protein E6G01_18180 [Actinobacteria bacterium]|nr:MAG: hypothetical protein E6G01_18180 [Actinomycetota bacterium]